MRLLDEAITLIKKHEGFSAEPYLCPGGVWTIGYGHTKGIGSHTPPVTPEHAETLLREDMATAEASVGVH